MSNSGVRKRLHSHQRLAIIVRLCPVQVFSFCRNITLLSLYISMYKRMGLYHRLGMVRIITKGQRRREANLIFLGATSLVFFFFSASNSSSHTFVVVSWTTHGALFFLLSD